MVGLGVGETEGLKLGETEGLRLGEAEGLLLGEFEGLIEALGDIEALTLDEGLTLGD